MKTYKRDKTRLAGKPKCPVCDGLIDGYTGVTNPDAIPKDGDVSVCMYCAAPLTVEGDKWVQLCGQSLAAAMREPGFMFVLRTVRKHVKRRRQ